MNNRLETLSSIELAEFLGVHERTAQKMGAKRILPVIHTPQGFRFPRHELVAWIEEHKS